MKARELPILGAVLVLGCSSPLQDMISGMSQMTDTGAPSSATGQTTGEMTNAPARSTQPTAESAPSRFRQEYWPE